MRYFKDEAHLCAALERAILDYERFGAANLRPWERRAYLKLIRQFNALKRTQR